MILAAPLVIPFAKALGLSVGVLGVAALSDKVNQFIQDNPEESMKILSTIVPGVGIGEIFMNKEEKISLEDLDGMSDEEAQDLSKEEKAELMKQAGKSGGPNKRQTMIDISEKLGLSGEGKEKQDIEYEIDERYDEGGVEEVSKPKFDYKKFFRKQKADGGSVGIEVLFEPKRKDFNIGGRATRVTPYDARASVQDFTNALQSVSAGTTYQQQAQAKEYARQQASSMLNQAMKSADPNKGSGLQGIYDTFFKNKNTGIGPSTFSPGASGRMISYSSKDRDRILDTMANQMLDTTNYSQSKVNERREKEYADYMNNLIASTYGKAGDYRAEAMTLNMPTEAYFDYLVTSDPKNKLSTRDVLSRDPYFDPKTYVPTDYSNPETPRPPSPYEVYYQQELQNQIGAGIPVGQRIQKGQVMGLPTLVGSGSQMGPGYEAYADVLARNKKMLGLKDGGRVGLFMGGDPLTGQALAIYNSMNAYGFSDQEIADALQAQGLYTPGSAPVEEGIISTAPNIINQGGGGGDGPSTPPGPTFNRDDNLGFSDYQGTGPGFVESILGIPAALVNAYTKISPGINFVKSIFKPRVETFYNQPNLDAIAKAEEERKAKAAAERAAFLAEQQRTNIASQLGGPDGTSGGKYAGGDAFASANPYGGSGTMDDLGADSFYKDGGLVTMFKKKR